MLKSIAGLASRLLLLGAHALEQYANGSTTLPSAPPEDDPLEPDAVESDGVLTDEARAMVAPRIPRPPKNPTGTALVGSLEWRRQQVEQRDPERDLQDYADSLTEPSPV